MTSPASGHTPVPGSDGLEPRIVNKPLPRASGPSGLPPDRIRVATRSTRLLAPNVWARIRFVADIVVLYVAIVVALLVGHDGYHRGAILLSACFPVVTLVVLRSHKAAAERLKTTFFDVVATVIGAVSLSAMIILAAGSILGVGHSLDVVLRVWVYCALYLSLLRYVLVLVRRRAVSVDAFATPTLILGAGVIGSHLATRLLGDPGYGMRPVALLDPNPLRTNANTAEAPVPVLQGDCSLTEAVLATGAQHVILAFSSEPDHLLAPKIRECQTLGIEVSLVPRMYEAVNERTTLDHLGGLPLLTLHTVDPRGWQFAIKHFFDRAVAGTGLVLASPALIVIAAAVKLSSPGPVLFRQSRVGRDGREFDLFKFRTMRMEPSSNSEVAFILPAGAAPGGVEGMDRRTGVGRVLRDLSFDELPQLINVLRGDMSLVGPRPERPEYVARFTQEVVGYENRHRVRSGITGWAQVHGLRGQTSIADRVEWDSYYILNWSLRLDFRILALTLAEVLRFRESD